MMIALHIRWYDTTCFAIVAAAIIASIWLLLRRKKHIQRSQHQYQHHFRYESLVTSLTSVSSDDTPAYVPADCLWRSAWRGVHPVVLLLLRLGAAVVLTWALLWDLHKYDPSIFVYYTDCQSSQLPENAPMATGDGQWEWLLVSSSSSFSYWLRWQTPVCLLITISPAIAAAVLLWRSNNNSTNRDHLPASATWSPCFRWVPPWVVPVYRGAVALGMSYVLYRMFLYRGLVEFFFYTQWTFLLVILYFLIGTVISAHGCWLYYRQKMRRNLENGDDDVHNRTALLAGNTNSGPNLKQESAGTWGYCMQIIYQTCGGAVMLTDVVFWCLLVPFMSSAHFNVNLLMGCMHSLNLLFLLLDTFLNSMPFPWFRMAYFILWSCTYVIFQWILHACGFSWWPYPFLELATPWAPFWYFCMALIHVPCYGIYWLIVKAKNTYFPRLFPHSYVRLYD